ncbi:MAG: DUF6901 family protein [Candidatus Competibacteraceae bacterium]
MENSVKITYSYAFVDGQIKIFDLFLDRGTLGLISRPPDPALAWTLLGQNQCRNCPLDAGRHPFCPIALNFAGIATHFADRISHEQARVVVATGERTYTKDTTLQQGLASLLGVIMATSGCPVMEPLKPMVQLHLPFATLPETVVRATSMYLLAQYLRREEGKSCEFGLDGLSRIYAEVAAVNRDFVRRLREAATEDANINALVGLDCFATMVPLITENMLREIRPYFSAYLDQ